MHQGAGQQTEAVAGVQQPQGVCDSGRLYEVHPGHVWVKQIQVELDWLHTFFSGNGPTVERFFSIDAFNRVGTVGEIGTGASPWGLGGWLAIDGVITEYFASLLTQADSEKILHSSG